MVVFVLLLSVGSGAIAAPALAQDGGPPDVPASYYGDVVVDGEPASEGAVVTAVVDGEERGSVTVGPDGQFGGPSVGDEKLEVPGDSDDQGEHVTFLVNGVEIDADPAIEWEPGAHQEVTLSGSDIGELDYEVSIDPDESTTEIQPNDTATGAAVVENTGDGTVPTTAEFTIDGGAFDDDVVDERKIEVDPGESENVPFAVQFDEEGEYDTTVTLADFGSASTTITVDEDADSPPAPPLPPVPPDPGEPNLQVTDATLSETSVDVGGTVTVDASIENFGEAEGTSPVSLTTDGEEVASEEVTLEAGATTTVSFEHVFDEAGSYDVAVDGTSAGTVTVEEPSSGGGNGTDDGDDGGDSEDDDGIPGFGIAGTVVALIAVGMLARRRR